MASEEVDELRNMLCGDSTGNDCGRCCHTVNRKIFQCKTYINFFHKGAIMLSYRPIDSTVVLYPDFEKSKRTKCSAEMKAIIDKHTKLCDTHKLWYGYS